MKNKKILGIGVEKQSKKKVLEKIKKYLSHPADFFHIVSINPENLVVACENIYFKKVVETAHIRIVDGIGVVLAAKILGIDIGERVTGVDLMKEVIKMASVRRLRVLLIGGQANLAVSLSNCYQQKYPEAKFFGLQGIKDIKNPKKEEEQKIFSIVSHLKPHIVLVAFGSPEQELWLACHKEEFKRTICMGVGGAFDYLGNIIPRAPEILQKIGLEWLFRLIIQPWRLKRQLRLIKFVWLVIKQKIRQ